MSRKRERYLQISLKAFFAFLSIAIVPIYTIIFGTKESPFEYTLSNIGNFFDGNYNTNFVVWGIVTGGCFAIYLLYTFTKLNYRNQRARRYLISSTACLFLTVVTPALKDIMPFLHFMHVVYSALFAIFLVASILLFLQYFAEVNQHFGKLAFTALLSTVAIPILVLFFTGLNGIVEILFFVCISIFLLLLNVMLDFVDKKFPAAKSISKDSNEQKDIKTA